MDQSHLHRLQSRLRRVTASLRREQARTVSDIALIRKLMLKAERLRAEVTLVELKAAAL